MSFQPMIILLQALFTGLIATAIVTLVFDFVSRYRVYQVLGEWPAAAYSIKFYGGLFVLALILYALTLATISASRTGIRLLTIGLAIILISQLVYGFVRFPAGYELAPTFAIDWVPFALIALYLLFEVLAAIVLALRTGPDDGRILSMLPEGKVSFSKGLRRAMGMPLVSDWMRAKRGRVTIGIALATIALAWLPFNIATGTTAMPVAIDAANLACPIFMKEIKNNPQMFNEKNMKQLGWQRLPKNEADCLTSMLPKNAGLFSFKWLQSWGWNITMLVLPILFGAAAWRFARSKIRFSIDDLTKSDQRAPILFLRPFSDDQVRLQKGKRSLLLKVLEAGRNSTTLDEVMLDEATHIGPVVALGNPHDQFPPYGAARNYFTNKNWQEAVTDLSEKSAAIVIVVDTTTNVLWEINYIFDQNLQHKTLFLLHPDIADPTKPIEPKLLIEQAVRIYAPTDPVGLSFANQDFLGFYFQPDGSVQNLCSHTRSRAAYLLALRIFFRTLIADDRKDNGKK